MSPVSSTAKKRSSAPAAKKEARKPPESKPAGKANVATPGRKSDKIDLSKPERTNQKGRASDLGALTASLKSNFGSDSDPGDKATSGLEKGVKKGLEARDPRGEYEVPKEEDGHNHHTDESNRTRKLEARQEAAVNEAIESGKPVEFTNSNGETEELTVKPGDDNSYTVQGEDGHEFKVSFDGDFSDKEQTEGLARIGEYYTQIPDHLRDANNEIEIKEDGKDGKPNVLADYKDKKIRFFNGLDNLDEATFDHEFGHAIGYKVEDETQTIGDKVPIFGNDDNGRPNDYDGAIEDDGNRISEYSDTNQKEDFAESWSAYMEARERGPEALEAFEEEYPHRTEILEKVYENDYK